MSCKQQIIEHRYHQIDIRDAAADFGKVLRRVLESGRRVEIIADHSAQSCVLISKAELDCLERAVEILGDSEAVQHLCGEIAVLAARSGLTPTSA